MPRQSDLNRISGIGITKLLEPYERIRESRFITVGVFVEHVDRGLVTLCVNNKLGKGRSPHLGRIGGLETG